MNLRENLDLRVIVLISNSAPPVQKAGLCCTKKKLITLMMPEDDTHCLPSWLQLDLLYYPLKNMTYCKKIWQNQVQLTRVANSTERGGGAVTSRRTAEDGRPRTLIGTAA